MSRVERDPFEGLLGKLMALPVVGIVYLVIRFWHFIPRMISFTGAWLLIAVLLGGPAYDYFINNYYMRIDGDFITFLMPTFVLSGIAVRNTIRVFRQPGTFIKKVKASVVGWLPVLLIWYSYIYGDYIHVAWGPTYDYSMAIFLAFLYAVVTTTRNTIRVIKTPARFKKLAEAARGVFFGNIIFGKKQIPATRDMDEDGHVLVVGGAGSGKSSCIAIPTLKKYWDGRFLAVDIKGELAQKSGREALIFNPADPNAYGYDPFYAVRAATDPTAAIREIALTLVPMPPETKDPFWIQSAQSILTGHLLYSFKEGAGFYEALEIIQTVKPNILLEVGCEDQQSSMYLTQFLDTKRETLASIMTTLSNHIIPYLSDPDIKRALTASNVITPDLLENGHDIFLQIPEHKIILWKSLIALIIQQFLTHFQRRPEDDNIPPILFLLDEFARLEKIDGILHGLATLRSKKICICIIIQSLAQLDAIYGTEQRKIIADNCAYKAVLKATDADTQKYFSALVGTEEVERKSVSRKKGGFMEPDDTSTTTSLVEKAIIRPEQFAYLNKELILFTPTIFIPVQKMRYSRTRDGVLEPV